MSQPDRVRVLAATHLGAFEARAMRKLFGAETRLADARDGTTWSVCGSPRGRAEHALERLQHADVALVFATFATRSVASKKAMSKQVVTALRRQMLRARAAERDHVWVVFVDKRGAFASPSAAFENSVRALASFYRLPSPVGLASHEELAKALAEHKHAAEVVEPIAALRVALEIEVQWLSSEEGGLRAPRKLDDVELLGRFGSAQADLGSPSVWPGDNGTYMAELATALRVCERQRFLVRAKKRIVGVARSLVAPR